MAIIKPKWRWGRRARECLGAALIHNRHPLPLRDSLSSCARRASELVNLSGAILDSPQLSRIPIAYIFSSSARDPQHYITVRISRFAGRRQSNPPRREGPGAKCDDSRLVVQKAEKAKSDRRKLPGTTARERNVTQISRSALTDGFSLNPRNIVSLGPRALGPGSSPPDGSRDPARLP